jgi:hypothetical protein
VIDSKENEMTRIEEIQDRLRQLPPEKQGEVFDFVSFLQQQLTASQQHLKQGSLREHPAFGSWRGRRVDALSYQRTLRSEWDDRA